MFKILYIARMPSKWKEETYCPGIHKSTEELYVVFTNFNWIHASGNSWIEIKMYELNNGELAALSDAVFFKYLWQLYLSTEA